MSVCNSVLLENWVILIKYAKIAIRIVWYVLILQRRIVQPVLQESINLKAQIVVLLHVLCNIIKITVTVHQKYVENVMQIARYAKGLWVINVWFAQMILYMIKRKKNVTLNKFFVLYLNIKQIINTVLITVLKAY